jgi:hypothetical protein
MKTVKNIFKIITGMLLLSFLFVSCIPKQESIGDAGQTLVKLVPNSFVSKALKMQSTTQTVTLLEVHKDVANGAALQVATSVVLKYDADTALLKAYNTAHSTTYIPLPPALYTLSPAISSGIITLNFDPATQDFAKSVMITIPNILNFDFGKKYALCFKVQSVTGEGTYSANANAVLVINVMAANKMDGKYTVTGSFVDFVYDIAGSYYAGYYPKTVNLITLGLTSVAKYDALGYYTYLFLVSPTSYSQFGNWTPCFTFDASNNIGVYNSTVDNVAGRNRQAFLYTDGSASNVFNVTTHSFDIAYGMSQDNVVPIKRNKIIEHYEYVGAR